MTTKIITVQNPAPTESAGADVNKGAPLNAAEFDQNLINLRAALDRKKDTTAADAALAAKQPLSSATTAQLNHLVGVTSPVQGQINGKAPTANPAFTGLSKINTTLTMPNGSLNTGMAKEINYTHTGSTSTVNHAALQINNLVDSALDSPGNIHAAGFDTQIAATSTKAYTQLTSNKSLLRTNGTGTIAFASVYYGTLSLFSSANVTEAVGLFANVGATATFSGTVTNACGIKAFVSNTTGTGTFTNAFGLYIGGVNGTNKWSVYANDATAPSYFAAPVTLNTGAKINGLSVFADNAAALAGGKVAGDVYRTATGVLMVTY
jgi:hypothetical protein